MLLKCTNPESYAVLAKFIASVTRSREVFATDTRFAAASALVMK